MLFGSQHTGNGKYHLIPNEGEESKELCHTKGTLLISYNDIELKDGLFYEIDFYTGKALIPDWMLKAHFCQKCIKKALQNESGLKEDNT